MSVGVRRGNLEIIREILKTDQGNTTQLRENVNLSHLQLQKYLRYLERSHLIRLERQNPHSVSFQVTEKGREALELLDRLFLALESEAAS